MSRGPTPEEFFERALATYKRAFDAGYYPALLDAFELCGMNDWPLPEWVWQHVAAQLEAAYANKQSSHGTRGRTGGRRASAEMDHIHCLRWSRARHWLANRELLPKLGHKPTRDGAFAYTSQRLQGTKAQGSAGAIRDSHRIVEKAIRAGEFARFAAATDDLRWTKPG